MVTKKELLSKIAVEKRLSVLHLKRIVRLRIALEKIEVSIDKDNDITDDTYVKCNEVIRSTLVITIWQNNYKNHKSLFINKENGSTCF